MACVMRNPSFCYKLHFTPIYLPGDTQPTFISFQEYQFFLEAISEPRFPYLYPFYFETPLPNGISPTMPTPEEMAHFQKLSEEYEPDLLVRYLGPW